MHERFGHLNFEALNLSNKEMVWGIPHIEHAEQFCDTCMLTKRRRLPFPRQQGARACAGRPLQLLSLWRTTLTKGSNATTPRRTPLGRTTSSSAAIKTFGSQCGYELNLVSPTPMWDSSHNEIQTLPPLSHQNEA